MSLIFVLSSAVRRTVSRATCGTRECVGLSIRGNQKELQELTALIVCLKTTVFVGSSATAVGRQVGHCRALGGEGAISVSRNGEALSCNHCYHVETIRIMCSECVL